MCWKFYDTLKSKPKTFTELFDWLDYMKTEGAIKDYIVMVSKAMAGES